jgi:hypothetical protein
MHRCCYPPNVIPLNPFSCHRLTSTMPCGDDGGRDGAARTEAFAEEEGAGSHLACQAPPTAHERDHREDRALQQEHPGRVDRHRDGADRRGVDDRVAGDAEAGRHGRDQRGQRRAGQATTIKGQAEQSYRDHQDPDQLQRG